MNKKKKQRTIIDNIDRCAELLEACSRYNKNHVAKLYGILAMLSRQLNIMLIPFAPKMVAVRQTSHGMQR